jgi:hypothetical protein
MMRRVVGSSLPGHRTISEQDSIGSAATACRLAIGAAHIYVCSTSSTALFSLPLEKNTARIVSSGKSSSGLGLSRPGRA